jgi:glycosyltransferase involved in cell wall biosynthesis
MNPTTNPTKPISVAITTFNEIDRSAGRWLRENLESILRSEHVGDVVVVNDATPDYGELSGLLYQWFGQRVRCQQNPENLAVFGNKLTSLEAARGEWCVIADSDNVFNAGYFNRLMECHPWDPGVAYVASFGRTEFDYRPFVGDWTLDNAADIPKKPCGWCLCNCGNWFVNREQFLATFKDVPRKRFDLYQPNYLNVADRTSLYWRHAYDSLDSFYINKLWWMTGGALRVVDGLEYVHRVDREKPGNFDRGPQEKEALGPIYLVELMDAAAGVKHGYTLIEQGGQCFYFERDDGATVIVNFHTGDVQVCSEKSENSVSTDGPSPCENSVPEGDLETSSCSVPSSKRTRKRTMPTGE